MSKRNGNMYGVVVETHNPVLGFIICAITLYMMFATVVQTYTWIFG